MRSLAILLLALWDPAGAAPADTTAPGPITAYTRYLAALDNEDLDAISRGADYFKAHITRLPVAEIDSACVGFMLFLDATISHHNDVIWEDLDFMEQLHDQGAGADLDMAAYRNTLDRNGLSLYTFGRLYYVDQQSDYLYHRFAPYVSRAVRDYLILRRDELAVGFADNATLLISLTDLGSRIIRWEKYLAEHPQSVLVDFASYYYRTYLNTLLTGLKNTPVFDGNGVIRPLFVTAYDDFSKRYSDTDSGDLIRQFYAILIISDFRWSPGIRAFYVDHGIRNMHTAQLPLR